MCFVTSCGDLSTIKINCQYQISLVRQLARLFFDPVVQSPPLVNDDDRRERAFAFGHVSDGLDRVAVALEADIFRGRSRS
jgi:hypothetical protein